MADTSTKPYLIRAIHEWCSDNGYTPYLAVAVDARCVVPRDYVKAGEIVLNVSISATNALAMGNELIEFQARFGGVARDISVPIECVTAVYARENGHGMAFDVPKPLALTPEQEVLETIKTASAKPMLKAVPDLSNVPDENQPHRDDASKLRAVDKTIDAAVDRPPDNPPNGPQGGPPKLKRVK
jgi:stringent starvation protein B